MKQLILLTIATALIFTINGRASAETEIKDITPTQAQARLAEDSAIAIIDIRTADEFAGGHIKGAKNIDYRDEGFEDRLKQLDREKTYIVHCRSGGRSTESLAIWKKLGFKSLLHLNKGILAWKEADLPLVKKAEK